MRKPGRLLLDRRATPRARRLVAAWLAGAVLCLAAVAPAAGREVSVAGSQKDRFGRIVLTFDQTTKVQVTATNGVLVISFAAPTRISAERLAAEMGRYASAVRRDPDGTGLRVALVAPVRTNVIEAGERVFVDLLPQTWVGLPPALPPEVVSELAERARVAEGKLKADAVRAAPKPAPVRLQLAKLPTLTRLVFEPPAGTVMRATDGESEITLGFDGRFVLDEGGEKARLAPGIAALDVTAEPKTLAVRIAVAPGFRAQSFREGETIVVDLAKPAPPRPSADLSAPAAAEQPVAAKSAKPPASAEGPPPAPPGRISAAGAITVEAPPPVPAIQIGPPPGPVTPRLEAEAGGTSVLFPFRSPAAAAAYERGGVVTLVFDTRDTLEPIARLDPAGGLGRAESRSEAGLMIQRFTVAEPGPVRLEAEGHGWRLWLKGGDALPPDGLVVARGADENGRALVSVALPGATKVHWLREPDGARVAVATSLGRVQGLAIARQFVEFDLPATLHGVVVAARSDDLAVGLGRGGVVVTREAGLSLTPLAGAASGAAVSTQVLTRDGWIGDRSAGALERYQELIASTASVPRSARAESRYRLARFLVANDMNFEAGSVLALARSEDPVFARRRETVLLSGIVSARAGRPGEARSFLSAEPVSQDPEAVLWRSVADAQERRWQPALAGFRRTGEVVRSYPDDLAGPIRLGALRAAIESGDVARAEGELASIDRLAPGSIPSDEHDLARARLDEAAGRTEAALKAYEKLAEDGGPRTSAEANLRGAALATKLGTLGTEAAIARLEILSVAWRGDEIEIGTIVELAQHYARAKRWRDLFGMTRRASRLFPDHELTRALYDQTAHLLENLLLGAEGEQLSSVQALGLYFDFKDLAPIGRRGDEIVRRLADRLVELDLLDQAADLLQYQVERRLSGAARATVAARLAAIRLMNNKPLPALQALQETRFADLPDHVRRFRFLLEARAQSDLSRADLALEILEGETGPDFDRLRANVLWSARRWREAGEAAEAMIGTRWTGSDPLSDRDRGDVLRSAIAYGLADEPLALDRLKTKLARKMLDSPDAQRFELLMRPGAVQTREFRDAMRDATRVDALKDLLADWRSRHPDAGLGGAAASAAAQAEEPDGAAVPRTNQPVKAAAKAARPRS